jgi:hypothetical protein
MLINALATLTLVLTDVQSRPIDARALQASAEAALAGSGLSLRWERAEAGDGVAARDGEARVILMSRHPIRGGPERVLGAVFRDPSRSRAIWLFVDEVRAVLERSDSRRAPAAAIRELSVALGRVLAHEVAHLLAPGRPHSEAGLMARTVDRSVLTREGEPIDGACLGAIRVALAGALDAVASPPAGGAGGPVAPLGSARSPAAPGLAY